MELFFFSLPSSSELLEVKKPVTTARQAKRLSHSCCVAVVMAHTKWAMAVFCGCYTLWLPAATWLPLLLLLLVCAMAAAIDVTVLHMASTYSHAFFDKKP